ncbi:hypothetical protein RF11_04344 [Thelohanellus kitauei]|uniref:Uncharacterized protein n=1 Tax=Thelohanellus kitauei TaxID=669202 RepID=A0A0C2JZJ1_THEKT|nr:hypothetical protein RF11_04344 [Thelohanellus kitauei]
MIVQIDESVISPAMPKRVRDLLRPQLWVLRMYDVAAKIGIVVCVPNRKAATLTEIIMSDTDNKVRSFVTFDLVTFQSIANIIKIFDERYEHLMSNDEARDHRTTKKLPNQYKLTRQISNKWGFEVNRATVKAILIKNNAVEYSTEAHDPNFNDIMLVWLKQARENHHPVRENLIKEIELKLPGRLENLDDWKQYFLRPSLKKLYEYDVCNLD